MVAACHASGARAKIADAEIVLIKQESEAVYACCGALAKPLRGCQIQMPGGKVSTAHLPSLARM